MLPIRPLSKSAGTAWLGACSALALTTCFAAAEPVLISPFLMATLPSLTSHLSSSFSSAILSPCAAICKYSQGTSAINSQQDMHGVLQHSIACGRPQAMPLVSMCPCQSHRPAFGALM